MEIIQDELRKLCISPLGISNNFNDCRLVKIIDLFYNKGGFEGILKHFKTIKEGINDESIFTYYYGNNLLNILNELISLKANENDLYDYVMNNIPTGYRYLHNKNHQDFNIFIFDLMYKKRLLSDFINFSNYQSLKIIELNNVIMFVATNLDNEIEVRIKYNKDEENNLFNSYLLEMKLITDMLLNEWKDKYLDEKVINLLNVIIFNLSSKLNK